jgi:hypothetical protein
MQDALHGAVQQAPVMADDDDRMGIFRQIAFQPQRPFQIKVVGRLIQQQQVGLRKQHPRQRHPHPPPAREIGTGPRLRLGVEAQALEDGTGPPLGRPGVDIGQPVLDLGDAVRVGGGIRLGQQGGAFGIASSTVSRSEVEDDGTSCATPPMRALRAADLAPLQRQLAPDQAEQRGLADPLRPTRPTLWP